MLIGNLNTDAPYIAGNVVAERDNKFYLVDISKWNALDANTINALTQGTLAGIDVAITGSAIVGVDSQIYKDYTTMSLEEFNQKHSYSDYLQKTVRTIIGWDNRSNVVFLILDNADFYTMLEKSAEVGISYGIVMDGGVSSQLFYENGFENVDSKLRENNPKVYDPSGQGRSVAGYVGAILNQTSQQLTRASATGNFSLIYPTDYKEIEHESLDYGYERSETWTHAGLDFVGTKGSPIYASASGTVIVARPVEPNHNRDAQPYGNFVMIEHSNGYVTLYAHLDKISVKKGDIVLAGDTIGTMGNTGNVYCEGNRRPSGPDDDTCGVHLHFELRKNKNCKWDGNPLTSVFGSCTMDPKPFLSGSVRGRQVFCGVDNTLNLDQTGVLGCNLNIKDINDNPDFAKLTPIISTRIKSYNLDDNLSHTWLYSPYESEELFNQIKDQKFNGSFDAAKLHAQFRKEVTDFVISKSKQLGVNPRLALTLWIEESGGSALGRAAMGCLYFRGTAQETSTLPLDYDPLDESYKQKTLDHLNEQIECLASYVNEFDNFREFMCTYSGESDRKNCQIFTNNPNFPVNVCRIYNYQEQKF
ncbi:MAG: hypothetical protein KatS3mg085_095 [Candidatus Dojkabacteria bacterium]|nr:MAG: hypothetical protein KatS3mg085_095 [Candidatus Dojkabacteria bacterium]